eukprot:TRINITY_DN8903_c0_g1_i1.p1 TRINITY_DN8903_c0_g1~~TRINITY_DN8903_c0_g1_i1.p1  ORF type:complete len:386 (+),score=46.33 TRINITY_DN8903_c0_g1_i1:277-1434(+)
MIRLCKELHHGALLGVCTRLSRRAVFYVEGSESYKFLNGLVTNKVDNAGGETHSIYAGFLSPRGRLLSDTILYHRPSSRSFFVEVSSSHLSDMVKHVNMYKLRSTVHIDDQVKDIYDVWSILAANEDSRDRILRNLLNRDEFGNNMMIYVDPRWQLSIRILLPKGTEPPLRSLDLHWSVDGNQDIYDYFRMANGISEGSEMPYNKQIPLEANMEYMNGVNFSKGCYLGQELIARTHFSGQIRKRIFALHKVYPYSLTPEDPNYIFSSPSQLIPPKMLNNIAEIDSTWSKKIVQPSSDSTDTDHSTMSLLSSTGQKMGPVLKTSNDVILAVIRLESLGLSEEEGGCDMSRIQPFQISNLDSEKWRVILPHWWNDLTNKNVKIQSDE